MGRCPFGLDVHPRAYALLARCGLGKTNGDEIERGRRRPELKAMARSRAVRVEEEEAYCVDAELVDMAA